jgi:asparagine synthase (glutamine-hydrolysing)
MFAFCLYDAMEGRFTIARDRFGIKPLFLYFDDDKFVFSSEMMALRKWAPLKADELSIHAYMQGFAFPTKAFSLIRGVKILPPGQVVRVTRGEQPVFSSFAKSTDLYCPQQFMELSQLKPDQLIDRFDDLFRRSIDRQMFADVPVGAYCSGGVDSSLVMAVAQQSHDHLAIFHANVLGNSETTAAMELARHLKLDLEVVEFSNQDFLGAIAETIAHFGAPFTYHQNSPAFLAVSKLARKNGVKAMLSGEGSDECFLGYGWLAPTLSEHLTARGLTPKSMLRRIFRRSRSGGPKIRRKPDIDSAVALYNRFEMVSDFAGIRELEHCHVERTRGDIRGLATLELLHYHLRTLLHRNDALGMAASIEARFPFLDTELVRFAVNLPYACKIRFDPLSRDPKHRFFVDKWIVRKVADRYLPKSLSRRTKKGFPVSAYQKMTIPSSLLRNGFTQDLFEFTTKEVDFLFEHASQTLKLRLLHLDVWAKIFLEGHSPATVQERLNRELTI